MSNNIGTYEEIVNRIILRLDELGVDQKRFAAEIGVSPTTVTDWKTGKSHSFFKKINVIAAVLATPLEWILTGTGYSSKAEAAMRDGSIHKPHGVKIPVLGNVAAGVPIEAVEEILDYEEIEPELAATGEFFGLRLEGHSMEPRMCEGDVVIVRCQNDVNTGDIAVVLVNGNSATVKRIKKESDGSIWLLPNNPTFSPTHYSPAEIESLPICIIGKVVEFRGKL